MPSDGRLILRFRLEDIIALIFFLAYLVVAVAFRGVRRENLSPGDVLIIIPAVALLLVKEVTHHFMSGEGVRLESREGVREFARPYWEILRDWFPFLVVMLMYYSLWGDATHLLVTFDRDRELIAWDQKLFGFQASVALQPIVSPPLTAWMRFAYFFHLLNIPVVACFTYLQRPRARFREIMCGVIVTTFFGLVGYLLVPAIGPIYTLRDQFTVPLSQPFELLNRQAQFLDYARIQRDCFPSLHVGLSFLLWMYAYRNSRRLFWLLAPLILSLWVSTVYLRFHYLVDVLAGLMIAPVCFVLANWLFKRRNEVPIPIVLPAAWAERIRRLGVGRGLEKLAGEVEERP